MTGSMTGPMTCDELALLARDASRALSVLDRGGDAPASVALGHERLQRVRDHLARCASCVEVLERERHLDARLAALAAEGDPPGPPPELEERLTRTFRARLAQPDVFDLSLEAPAAHRPDPALQPPAGVRPHRARRLSRMVAGGLTIAAAATAVALVFVGRARPPTVAVDRPPTALPVPAEERGALPIVGAGAGAGSVDTEVVVVRGDAIVRSRGGAFVPLGWDGSGRPIEYGRITRVRLPTAIAARFGWPLLPDAPEALVAADVLVGEDGTARALRFLPATYTPTSR